MIFSPVFALPALDNADDLPHPTAIEQGCQFDSTLQNPRKDTLSHSRLLRRMILVLAGRLPSESDYAELLTLPDHERENYLARRRDTMLADPVFYDQMLSFARQWFLIPPTPEPAPYLRISQQRRLDRCPKDTVHAGALSFTPVRKKVCNGESADSPGKPARYAEIEPWWAEGTIERVVGEASVTDSSVKTDKGVVDCGEWTAFGWYPDDANVPNCGCGPNLIFCSTDVYPNHKPTNSQSQRRHLWDESSRLFAHIAWHDKPVDDLILSDYSVGTVKLQAAYVRLGRRSGVADLDKDESWWRSSKWTAPNDPHHKPTDPYGWSEFSISTRSKVFLADRNLKFDPRKDDPSTFKGIPSAGMLTSLGVLTGWPRERVRGARLLEILACDRFIPPPADFKFNEYINDPGSQGPCQHCHIRIDPAAIHFKRFVKLSHGAGTLFALLGVNDWHWGKKWIKGRYHFAKLPWTRINALWLPNTRMTPIKPRHDKKNPESRWIDFLPADQSLYGNLSDGTVGPLGFGKLILKSGVFDRCVVRKIHEHVIGRDIDPVSENGYLQKLTEDFVADDQRRVRRFIVRLMKSELFRRGL